MKLATVSGEPVKMYVQIPELGSGSTLHVVMEMKETLWRGEEDE